MVTYELIKVPTSMLAPLFCFCHSLMYTEVPIHVSSFFSSFLPHLPGIFFHIECMVHRGVHINLQLNEGVVYTCQFFSSIVLRERSYIFKDAAFKTTSLGISARGDLATSCTKEELLMIGGAAVLCGNI